MESVLSNGQVPEITLEGAREHLDGATASFVDIRDPHSFEMSHIPGATHLTDQNVAEFMESADRSRPLVVYCYHGHSSMGATAWFLQQGFEDVASMTGGFTAWQAIHPVEGS